LRNLNPCVSGDRNSRMRLPDYGEHRSGNRATNKFGRTLATAIVDNYDFEIGHVNLAAQGSQTLVKRFPVVENTDDDAEEGSRASGGALLARASWLRVVHRLDLLIREDCTARHKITTSWGLQVTMVTRSNNLPIDYGAQTHEVQVAI
jgi:hypothetical protein